MGAPLLEIKIGEKFARLTVTGPHFHRPKDGRGVFPCLCECGNVKEVAPGHLRGGSVSSCGCRRKAALRQRNLKMVTHGMYGTPEYKSWSGIIDRCTNQKSKDFTRYGGRGISICDEWRRSFQRFFDDIGPRPGKGYSVERIENEGPYSKENCKWATPKEQARNRRSNVQIEIGGVTRTACEWEDLTGVRAYNIVRRSRAGLTPDQILYRHDAFEDPHATRLRAGQMAAAKRWGWKPPALFEARKRIEELEARVAELTQQTGGADTEG